LEAFFLEAFFLEAFFLEAFYLVVFLAAAELLGGAAGGFGVVVGELDGVPVGGGVDDPEPPVEPPAPGSD
jgi:hypothetical protein